MLCDWAKNKKDEKRINQWWNNFCHRNGHNGITIDNFVRLGYTALGFKIDGRRYSGFFTSEEVDRIFELLDYHEGEIISMAG